MSLNVEFLRWKSKTKAFSHDETMRFSRRHFLQGSAAMAIVQSLNATASEKITLRHEGQHAAIFVDDTKRWSFTPKILPDAKLRVLTNTASEFELEILGGHYAGTDIALDFRLRAARNHLGWMSWIELPLEDFKAQVDLSSWLAGERLSWSNKNTSHVRNGDSPIAIRTLGRTVASLDCTWCLRYEGQIEARLPDGKPHRVTEAHLQPSVSTPDMVPLAIHDGPYSRIKLQPGPGAWGPDTVPMLKRTLIEVPQHEVLFDQLHVDLWEPQCGTRPAAASFSRCNDRPVSAKLRGSARGSDGGAVLLRLCRPAFTIGANGNQVATIFLASLDHETTAWSDGHAVTLDRMFEVSSGLDSPGKLAASVGVSAVSVHEFDLNDGTIADLILPDGMKLPALHLDGSDSFFRSIEEFFEKLFTGARFELSLDRVKLRLLRPADMLHLKFSFSGLKLKMHLGRPYLEAETVAGTMKTPSITVEFPPQNMQEESYQEDAAGNDSDKSETIAPRVKTMSAQPSRLRFKIPMALFKDGRLAFTMETLLGWDKFTFQPGRSGAGKRGTSIEMPYRLYLTPPPEASFLHNVEPRNKVTATEIDLSTKEREQAPELWGSLIQTDGQAARQGFDAKPITMQAFAGADVVEILRIQALSPTNVLAYVAGPFQLSIGGGVTIYAAGPKSAPYAGSSLTITKVHPPDPNNFPHLYSIEYTPCGGHAPFPRTGSAAPPPSPLWIVQSPTVNAAAPGGSGLRRPPMVVTDRAQIVVLTSGENATPIHVNRLELTALGAWFDADTTWDLTKVQSSQIDLTSWKHITVQGRDAFVQIEYRGFLFPFGHEAVFVVRTERAFFSVQPVDTCGPDKLYCYMRQREFVKVTQPTISYPVTNQPNAGRDSPFRRVDITTPITPPLDDPRPPSGQSVPSPGFPSTFAMDSDGTPMFSPTVLGQVFQFDLIGYDWHKPANKIPFKAPLIFVPDGMDNSSDTLTATDAYANKLDYSTANAPALAVPVSISSFSIGANNVATFVTPNNTLSPDQRVVLSFPDVPALNGQKVKVQAENLSRARFQAQLSPVGVTSGSNGQAWGVAGNVVQFAGQHIYFAESAPPTAQKDAKGKAVLDTNGKPILNTNSGDTELKVDSITFAGKSLTPVTASVAGVGCAIPIAVQSAAFYPSLQYTMVDVPAVQSLEGRASDIYGPFAYERNFVSKGFDGQDLKTPNIFVTAIEGTQVRRIDFPGQHGGGLGIPRNYVQSVSRSQGALNLKATSTAAPSTAATPVSTAARDFFAIDDKVNNILGAKLFGVISLADLLGAEDLNLDQMPGIVPQAADAAATVYTTVAGWANQATAGIAQVTATEKFLATVQKQATAEVQQQLTAELMQLSAPYSPYFGSIKVVASGIKDKQSVLTTALNAIQALPQPQRQAILDTVAQADGTISNLEARLENKLQQEMTDAINGVALAAFQVQQTVEQLLGILNEAQTAAGDIVTELQNIQAQLQELESDLAVQCAANQSCGDLKAALTLFVREQVQKELNLAAQQAASGIGQQLASPALALQQQADVYLDSVTTGLNAAVVQAIEVVGQGQAQAVSQIQAAQAQYDEAIAEAQTTFDSAAAQVQDLVNQAINDAVSAAISTIVANVVSNQQVAQAISDGADAFGQTMTLVTTIVGYYDTLKKLLQTPLQYGVNYSLPKLLLHNNGMFVANNDAAHDPNATGLLINASINVGATLWDPPQTNVDYKVEATINDFGIALLENGPDAFLTVNFDHVTFSVQDKQSPQVHCQLNDVSFGGAMAFVQGLASAFGPLQSGKSGPSIVPASDSLSIGYGFSFPDEPCGGFQITGLYLAAQVVIPFTDKPLLLRFYFARPEKHFLMSAGIYGGGGYLILEAAVGDGPAHIDSFQLCLEFGAAVALDLGVADGEVHVLGGIYIGISSNACVLTGFVRAGGSMNVLDLVTMSIEWYLGLTYTDEHDRGQSGGKASGEASVTVSISIGFFSVGATMSFQWGWQGDQGQSSSHAEFFEPRPQEKLVVAGGRRSQAHLEPAVYTMQTPAPAPQTAASAQPPPCASTKPAGLKRMQYLNTGSWNAYAAAFAQRPNT
jgi:hypothetical protein